jgi:hypothetical protein
MALAGTIAPPQEIEMIGLPEPGVRYAEDLSETNTTICASFFHDLEQRRWSHYKLDQMQYYLLAGEAIRDSEFFDGDPGVIGYPTAEGMLLFQLNDEQLFERAEELAAIAFPVIHVQAIDPDDLGPSLNAFDVEPKKNCRQNNNPKTPPCDGDPKDCMCIYIVIPD